MERQLTAKFADGSRAQVYTLVKVNQWLPELKQLVVQFVLAMIFILFFDGMYFHNMDLPLSCTAY